MIIDELVAVLGYKMAPGSEAELKKYEKGLQDIEKAAFRVGQQIGRMAAMAGAAVAAGFGLLGKGVLDTAGKFEQFQTTLETIEGSAEKAKKSMAWISEFAKKTPYEVEGITAAFVKLKAYGVDPMNGTLKTLGDTASAMGKTLDQAVEAFADASTGEFERLKTFGITSKTVGDQVTFAWDENGKHLTKTIKKNSTEIQKFLTETFGRRFGGAMDKQAKTFKGMMSNLSDAWTDFERRIADKGFFDAAKQKLELLLKTIERWDKDGTLDKAAKFISGIFEGIASVIGTVAERIATHVKFINENWETFKPVLKWMAVGLAALVVWAFPLTSAFIALGLAVEDWVTYMEGGESVIGDLLEQFPALAQWLKDLKPLYDDVFGSKGLGEDPWKDFRKLGELWTSFEKQWDSLIAKRNEFFSYFDNLSTDIYNKFVAFGTKMGDAIYDGLVRLKDKFVEWFMSLLPDWMRKFMPASSEGPVITGTIGGGGSNTVGGSGGSGGTASFRGERRMGGGLGKGLNPQLRRPGGGGGGGRGIRLNEAQQTEMASAIKASAARLKMDPEDLATFISFETGGTMDPNQKGPTTKWGQHKGLIQWGQPQREHWAKKVLGRSWGDDISITDQMKMVEQYLLDNGFKPGVHGGMNAYAAVNAGNATSIGARDAAAGGTWGTVADKWKYQMGGHRAKARKLLGGGAGGTPSDPGAVNLMRNYDDNLSKTNGGAAGATITNDRSSKSSSINVTAPVNVNVAKADQAPDATARAVGAAVQRGASAQAKPSRMQASAAA